MKEQIDAHLIAHDLAIRALKAIRFNTPMGVDEILNAWLATTEDDLFDKIANTKACTAEGVAVKLRVITEWPDQAGEDIVRKCGEGVAADVERLLREGSS